MCALRQLVDDLVLSVKPGPGILVLLPEHIPPVYQQPIGISQFLCLFHIIHLV